MVPTRMEWKRIVKYQVSCDFGNQGAPDLDQNHTQADCIQISIRRG